MNEGVSFFAVEFKTPFGIIRGKVQVSEGPMRLVDLVSTALEFTDILVKRAIDKEEKEGRKIYCGPGCGVCCNQMVPLSPPEAIWISELVDHLEKSGWKELSQKFDRIAEKLEQLGMVGELLDPDFSDDVALEIAKKYFQLSIPCPFLVDNSCRIYPYRPVACREYNVTSPPEFCRDPYSNQVNKVPMPLPLSAPLARLTAKLTGTKPRLIPLVLTRKWYFDNKELVYRKWEGTELLRGFLKELGGVNEDN